MNPNEWSYLAEGGANIVFKHAGDNEKYKGKVLRIRKSPPLAHFIELIPVYYKYLMNLLSLRPLEMEPIRLKEEFVKALLQSCDHLRPAHRKQTKHPESDEYWAFLMPSLVDHDCYTCEIKPKWSGRKHFHYANVSKACECRFCEAQLRKGRRQEYESDSVYCPKLLFSPDQELVSTAIRCLFAKPSNQLRIFKKGMLVTGPEELINALTEVIVQSEAIQRYIELQHDLLEEIDLSEVSFDQYKRDILSLSSNPPIKILPPYLRLLLAMSLRDCSLMISLLPEGPILYFIDLDIKPLEKLQYYYSEVSCHG